MKEFEAIFDEILESEGGEEELENLMNTIADSINKSLAKREKKIHVERAKQRIAEVLREELSGLDIWKNDWYNPEEASKTIVESIIELNDKCSILMNEKPIAE